MICKKLQLLAISIMMISGSCLAVTNDPNSVSFRNAALNGDFVTVWQLSDKVSEGDKNEALLLAVIGNSTDIVGFLLGDVVKGQQLSGKIANVHASRNAPLLMAKAYNYPAMIQLLISKGADTSVLETRKQ